MATKPEFLGENVSRIGDRISRNFESCETGYKVWMFSLCCSVPFNVSYCYILIALSQGYTLHQLLKINRMTNN